MSDAQAMADEQVVSALNGESKQVPVPVDAEPEDLGSCRVDVGRAQTELELDGPIAAGLQAGPEDVLKILPLHCVARSVRTETCPAAGALGRRWRIRCSRIRRRRWLAVSGRPQTGDAALRRFQHGQPVVPVVRDERRHVEAVAAVGRDGVPVAKLHANHREHVGHVGQGQGRVSQDARLPGPVAFAAADPVLAGVGRVGEVQDRVVGTIVGIAAQSGHIGPVAAADEALRVDDRDLLAQTDPAAARVQGHQIRLEREFAVGRQLDHRGTAVGEVRVDHRASGRNVDAGRGGRAMDAAGSRGDRENFEALTLAGRVVNAEQNFPGVVAVADQDVGRPLCRKSGGNSEQGRQNQTAGLPHHSVLLLKGALGSSPRKTDSMCKHAQ